LADAAWSTRYRQHGAADLPTGDGAAYDEERGRSPYNGGKHFEEIKEFFCGRCCYCGVEFGPTMPAVQDHLVPMNKAYLGLHAWGNVVPACQGLQREEAAQGLARLHHRARRSRSRRTAGPREGLPG